MAWLQYYLIRIGEVSLKRFYIKNYVRKLYNIPTIYKDFS